MDQTENTNFKVLTNIRLKNRNRPTEYKPLQNVECLFMEINIRNKQAQCSNGPPVLRLTSQTSRK